MGNQVAAGREIGCVRAPGGCEAAGQARTGGDALDAAMGATATQRTVGPDDDVADVAGVASEPMQQLAIEDDAAANAFGFATVLRSQTELLLRGTDEGAPCTIVRRGPRTRFLGAAYQAQDEADLLRLANATATDAKPLPADKVTFQGWRRGPWHGGFRRCASSTAFY